MQIKPPPTAQLLTRHRVRAEFSGGILAGLISCPLCVPPLLVQAVCRGSSVQPVLSQPCSMHPVMREQCWLLCT